MAKSQSEIMGIAIVMVIVVFGLLIFISFNSNKTHIPISLEYTYKQIPVMLNNAILETHTTEDDCYGEKMQKILIKAGEGNTLVCKNGKRAKEFAEENIKKILNETLDLWGMDYRYTVYVGTDFSDEDSFVIFLNNSDCRGMNIDTENFFFRMADGQFLNVKLDLCYW